jgi:hypothetical protein
VYVILARHLPQKWHRHGVVFHVFAALAEFERNLIRERTVAGLKAARARGRKGGRPANSPLSNYMVNPPTERPRGSFSPLFEWARSWRIAPRCNGQGFSYGALGSLARLTGS